MTGSNVRSISLTKRKSRGRDRPDARNAVRFVVNDSEMTIERQSVDPDGNFRSEIACDHMVSVLTVYNEVNGEAVKFVIATRKTTAGSETKRITIPACDLTPERNGLFAHLSKAGVNVEYDPVLFRFMAKILHRQSVDVAASPISAFCIPGIDADKRVIVGRDGVILNGEIVPCNDFGLLHDGNHVIGFVPDFSAGSQSHHVVVPRVCDIQCCYPLDAVRAALTQWKRIRGDDVLLAIFLEISYALISPKRIRELFRHSRPNIMVTGSSGVGKNDYIRELFHVLHGFPLSDESEYAGGSSMALVLSKLARSFVPLSIGEANKGGEKGINLANNSELNQMILKTYDGTDLSNHTKMKQPIGHLVLSSVTVPRLDDELSKRLIEIPLVRREQDLSSEIDDFRNNIAFIRAAVLHSYKIATASHWEGEKRFFDAYGPVRERIAASAPRGCDFRHIGHLASICATAKCFDNIFGAGEEVERACIRRVSKTAMTSPFLRTVSFLNSLSEVLLVNHRTHSGQFTIPGLCALGTLQHRRDNHRIIFLAVNNCISLIKSAQGSRWHNPCGPSQIYENIGVSKGKQSFPWALLIDRDATRLQDAPLNGVATVALFIDVQGFPEDIMESCESILGLLSHKSSLDTAGKFRQMLRDEFFRGLREAGLGDGNDEEMAASDYGHT